MKELRVVMRVRNNRLQERRESLGMTQAELADAAGVAQSEYSAFERMGKSPMGTFFDDGIGRPPRRRWRRSALLLAAFHSEPPEELFPDAVLESQVNAAVIRVDADEARALLGNATREPPLLPSEALEAVERREAIDRALSRLTPRERRVIEARFGLDDGGDGKTLGETALVDCPEDPRSTERIRGIEAKALRKLRHPSLRRGLDPFADEGPSG